MSEVWHYFDPHESSFVSRMKDYFSERVQYAEEPFVIKVLSSSLGDDLKNVKTRFEAKSKKNDRSVKFTISVKNEGVVEKIYSSTVFSAIEYASKMF